MSYEEFEKYMSKITRLLDFEDSIQNTCRISGFDWCEIKHPTLIDECVALLSVIMEDTQDEWIRYWVFELDCGKKYTQGSVKDENGNAIPMKTIRDLYDYLTSKK